MLSFAGGDMSEGPFRWRKKPVVIQAVRLSAADDSGHRNGSPFILASGELPEWLAKALEDGTVHLQPGADHTTWAIRTREGTMTAGPGDWIIRGVQGELYPCKADIFAATYEQA